ncbi:hypothetical protein HCU40_21835 (plasmid) [Pseudanabaena biceps]|nr:hypothetical protein [Pseudanabaena biceps]
MMSTPSAQAKAFSTQALTTSMESGNKPLREQPIKQDILKALAPHPQGITESELQQFSFKPATRKWSQGEAPSWF